MSKLPPNLKPLQAVEIEKAILGTVLLYPERLPQVLAVLNNEDFYHSKNRVIFQRMKELHAKGEAVDIVILNTELPDEAYYLAELSGIVPIGRCNLESYCSRIKQTSQKRQIASVLIDALEVCNDVSVDPLEILDEYGGLFFKIAGEGATSSTAHISQVVPQVVGNILIRSERGDALRGISSGFYELDAFTSGLVPSELIVLAARPSMGKTALALNITENIAKKDGRVLFFSLEMGKEQLVERLLASVGHIHGKAIRDGQIDERQRTLLNQAGSILIDDYDIIIDDSAGVSIDQLRAKAKTLHQQKPIDCIVVDYLQLLKGSGNNREQEISSISRGLKMLAKELNCPVIALSQLNRNSESRTDKRPMTSDLRESGAIEQDADIILLLYRDEKYHPDSPAKGKADILIEKNRAGSTGKAKLGFNGAQFQFTNLA